MAWRKMRRFDWRRIGGGALFLLAVAVFIAAIVAFGAFFGFRR